jgi:hypothetical protein
MLPSVTYGVGYHNEVSVSYNTLLLSGFHLSDSAKSDSTMTTMNLSHTDESDTCRIMSPQSKIFTNGKIVWAGFILQELSYYKTCMGTIVSNIKLRAIDILLY